MGKNIRLAKLNKEIERVGKMMVEAEEYAAAVRKLGEEIDLAIARKQVAHGYNR